MSNTTPPKEIIDPDSGMIIPILGPGEPLTKDYIAALDTALKSDGCTGVKDIYRACCIVHDLGCEHHIDPWGNSITRRETDANFRRCMQSKSPLGKYSPVAFFRWLGVRLYAIVTGKD